MTFKQMVTKHHMNDFLYRLQVLKVEKKQYKLSLYPDFDSTKYEKYNQKDYVFFYQINFQNEYSSIVKCILDDYGFCSDDEALNEVLNHDNEKLVKEIGDDKINKVKIFGIDNIKKTIDFYGAFNGDNYTIDMDDIDFVANCLILYIDKNISQKEFYYQLLAESRLLMEEGKNNLAFFTAFSAIDLYINYWEDYHKLEKKDDNGKIINQSLDDRLKAVYKNAIDENDLSKNVIWNSVIADFNTLTKKRNDIAHGRKIEIGEEDYKLLLAVISSLIITMEKLCETFDDVENY